MNRFFFLFFFLQLIFTQNIKISISDKNGKEPIEGAEVFYGEELYTTNETGLVLFKRKVGIKKVEIKHVSYKSIIFFLTSKSEYEINLEEAIYTNEIIVSAYRKKPIIINETEVKQKKINVSSELIKLSSNLSSLVNSIDNVHIDKSIDGSSNINILASNSDEVNFKINKLNLFLLSNSESYVNSLIPLSLKSVDLELGNSDHFIGTINAQFDYSAKNMIMASTGNNYNDFKLSYNTSANKLITLNSISYTGSDRDYAVEDKNNRIYNYPIADEYYRLNSLQNLFLDGIEIENVIVYDFNQRYYLTTIDKSALFFADGLNIKLDENINIFNNFSIYDSKFKNLSSNSSPIRRNDRIIENQVGIEFQKRYEANSVKSDVSISSFSNKISQTGFLFRDDRISDFKKNLNFLYKYLPERSEGESRVIFEVNYSLGHYNNILYMENLGLKSSIDVQDNHFIWEFYTDLTFNKRPFIESQKLISHLSDVGSFLKTDNLLFGTKINYRKYSFDFNYSNRNYSQFLNKKYDLIFFNYTFHQNVIMRVYNINMSQKFSKHLDANLSAQYFISDNDLAIFNRPKLLITNNYQGKYRDHELLISLKFLKDRHIVTSYNGIDFKRLLDETLLANISYKYSNFLKSKFSLSVEFNNILGEPNYTINGFNLKQKDYYLTLAYEY